MLREGKVERTAFALVAAVGLVRQKSRMLAERARAVVHSWSAHDAEKPWGVDSAGIVGVLEALGDTCDRHGAGVG